MVDNSKISSLWSVGVLAVSVLLFALVFVNFVSLPDALSEGDQSNGFIGRRAHADLRQLTSFGPRITGSNAHEVLAINFLKQKINDIIENANPMHRIEIDHQIAAGSFLLKQSSDVHIFQGVQNIVVRISPANATTPEHSLLLNAHLDSVPSSPGAGDDGSMSIVQLELLRTLSQSTIRFKHAIIFVWNGSEENGLQGAYAYITAHKWAKTVRAFINVDAAGSGGREIMFQAGPGHPWLMNHYRKSAPRPYCTAMAEELFQANLVPSDTDYRQFRDFGQIPGMDFAYNTRGYTYHTKYDTIAAISANSLQHTGDNLLPLIVSLANAVEMENTSAHADGQVVFYDFLNWFMIFYTKSQGVIINCVVAIVALCVIALSLYSSSKVHGGVCVVCIEFGKILLVKGLSLLVGIGLVMLLSVMLDVFNRSMSWFAEPWLIGGIYFMPLLFGMCIVDAVFLQATQKLYYSTNVQLLLHAQCLFQCLILIILTIMGIRSAYLFLISTLFYTITTLINTLTKWDRKTICWLCVHLVGQIVPFLFYSSLAVTAFATFIPIAGRNGGYKNPETMIALFSASIGMLMIGFIVPLIGLFRKRKIILSGIVGIWLIHIIMIITPLGFPYREATSPQRQHIYHAERVFHAANGSIRKMDSGFFIHAADRHFAWSIDQIIPKDMSIYSLDLECATEMFCGIPYYWASTYFQTLRGQNVWIEAGRPKFPEKATLKLKSSSYTANNTMRYSFTMSVIDHLSIQLSVVEECKLTNWSLTPDVPHAVKSPMRRDLYFIGYLHGQKSPSYDFYLDITGQPNGDGIRFEIAIAGQYVNYEDYHTEEFKKFLDYYPEWTVNDASTSSYESWQY